jgi:DNA ligase-associated metallophosphoesterase
MLSLTLAGEQSVLLPEKALWLPEHGSLLVADVHLGKAASFRKHGVPVPRGSSSASLQGLSGLIERLAPSRLVFLGDFLHAAEAHNPATLQALSRWRDRHPSLDLVLVRGNHDDRAGDPPADLEVQCVDEPWPLGAFALCHHPAPQPAAYVLAGHWHPCVSLYGRAHDRLRLPCFWFGAQVGVLPAYGHFTGMHPVAPAAADRIYAVAGGEVVAVPTPG